MAVTRFCLFVIAPDISFRYESSTLADHLEQWRREPGFALRLFH